LIGSAAISATAAFAWKSRKTWRIGSCAGQSGWSRDRVVEAMQGTESIPVKVKRPIQVVLMYVTAVVMSNGEVHFFRDIYGEDQALEKELAAQRK
jgi:murein L,D-transpeptidase YcbB/YkuD